MIKVAIMGCGTIGSGVYEVIEENQAILKKELGDEIRVSRILDLREFPGTPYEKLVTRGDYGRNKACVSVREGLPPGGQACRHQQ